MEVPPEVVVEVEPEPGGHHALEAVRPFRT
jgi:hypothetical protein